MAGWFIVHFVQIRSPTFDFWLRSKCHSVAVCCVARQNAYFCSHVVTLSIHMFVKSHALALPYITSYEVLGGLIWEAYIV